MLRVLGIGAVLMVVADTVVGLRLLAIARRTRRLPEAALGAAFVLLGAIGYPLATAARRGVLPSDEANAGLLAAGFLAQNLGCLAMYVHVARTFRGDAPWASRLAWAAGAAFAISWVGQGLENGFRPGAGGAAYALGLAVRTGAFAWASWEALRCHAAARRRLRLGLADPVVTNRFLLFGLSSLAVLGAFVAFTIGRIATPDVAESGWVLAATGASGLVAAATTWLAFLPPEAWRRRLRARAAQLA